MQLVFASNNPNKIKEIQLLLPKTIEVLSLNAIGCTEDIPETAPTIEGNAMQKANYITQKYGYSCFADDTGLEVEALKGEPGVYSARYAGQQRDANDNVDKLLTKLAHTTNRKAQFKTIICLNLNNTQHLFEGIVHGTITTQKSGTEGFGYDPIFIPDGYNKTFAQMPIHEKSKISHRGLAIQKLINHLNNLKPF